MAEVGQAVLCEVAVVVQCGQVREARRLEIFDTKATISEMRVGGPPDVGFGVRDSHGGQRARWGPCILPNEGL